MGTTLSPSNEITKVNQHESRIFFFFLNNLGNYGQAGISFPCKETEPVTLVS